MSAFRDRGRARPWVPVPSPIPEGCPRPPRAPRNPADFSSLSARLHWPEPEVGEGWRGNRRPESPRATGGSARTGQEHRWLPWQPAVAETTGPADVQMRNPGAAGSLHARSGPQPRTPGEASVGRGQPRPALPAPGADSSLQRRAPRASLAPAGGSLLPPPGQGGLGARILLGLPVSPPHPELCLHTCPHDLSLRPLFLPIPPTGPSPPPVGVSFALGLWSGLCPTLSWLLLPPLCPLSPHLSLNRSVRVSASSPSTPVGPSPVSPPCHTPRLSRGEDEQGA